MKKLKLILVILPFLALSCKQGKTDSSDDNLIIYQPKYSKGFEIQGALPNGKTKIVVYNPWQGAQNVSSDLMINKKAERIICMSSTHIAMLDALGESERIVGVSGKQYISNDKIRNNSSIPDIGYEGNIDYEKIIASKPDLILLFSVNGSSTMEPKLKELGIPYMYIGDYVEEDPLGKAEWIVPIAEIVQKREEGIKQFLEIEKQYNKLKEFVIKENLPSPKVMVNAPFMDSWFMPSTKSYVARMIKDAGGEYIYSKNTGNSSLPIDLEEALNLVSKADIWINIGNMKSRKDVVKSFPKFTKMKCVVENALYNNNKITSPGGGNDCYESGVIFPHLILRDMIKIFHPELIEEDFIYYQHLN